MNQEQMDIIRAAMRLLRAIPSEARAEASRRNGRMPVKPGSRPRGRPKTKRS